MSHSLALESRFYRLDDLRPLLAPDSRLSISPEVAAQITKGADFVAKLAYESRYVYGVNTGFGALCETRVTPEEMPALQLNHVLSHACGVGELVPESIARLTVFIKLLTFRTGHTGISLPTVERLVEFWNAGLIPTTPKRGTVGASGDLAPLAHLALPLLGLGSFYRDGATVPAAVALAEKGWGPITLAPKEGLALTNGVQYINAHATHALMRITDLVRAADVVAAISAQAFSAAETFFHELYHQTSFHQERRDVASNLRKLLAESNHYTLPTCNKSKQDPYSFRCLPQVHGAVRQAVRFATEVMENEINGVSDNPLFFADEGEVLFGGNLHGQSTAFSLDFLAMAMAELSSISERRTYQLLSGRRGLPDFLVGEPGRNSGLMIAQYTSAALVNENKVLSNPASVDTIPTCQLQEDSVSMGGTSAYKLMQVMDNLEYALGIELMTAAQAVPFVPSLRLSPSTQAVVDAFREQVAFLEEDRVLAGDIEKARTFVVHHAPSWRRSFELA